MPLLHYVAIDTTDTRTSSAWHFLTIFPNHNVHDKAHNQIINGVDNKSLRLPDQIIILLHLLGQLFLLIFSNKCVSRVFSLVGKHNYPSNQHIINGDFHP